MKNELTRDQMEALIASDYGFGPEITKHLKTNILRDVCDASHPHVYLSSLLELANPDIYLKQ